MSMEEVLRTVRSFDGVLELAPSAGSEYPEIAWGDHFFYYAPDGTVPPGQPYATIVTKDYPDDVLSRLDGPGRWRLNVHVGRRRLRELTPGASRDPAEADVLVAHPLYGALGWVAVVNPGERTTAAVLDLLREAHAAARRRATRRGSLS